MSDPKHMVGRQRFEIKVRNKKKVEEVFQILSDFSRHEFPETLNKVLDQVNPDEEILQIDRLVIDVGTVPLSDLKSAILNAFTKKILELMEAEAPKARSEEDALDGKPPHQVYLRAIQQFLRQGNWPWWHTAPLEYTVEYLLKMSPSTFVQLLKDLGPEPKIFRRMYLQIPEPLLRVLSSQVWETQPKEIRNILVKALKGSKESLAGWEKPIDDKAWWVASLYFKWYGKIQSRTEGDSIVLILQSIWEEGTGRSEKTLMGEKRVEGSPETPPESSLSLPDEASEIGPPTSHPADETPLALVPPEWAIIRHFLLKGKWPSEASSESIPLLEKWLINQAGSGGKAWRNSMADLLKEETTRRRLVASFSETSIEAVIGSLSTPEGKWVLLRQQWVQFFNQRTWRIFSDQRVVRALSLLFLEEVIFPKSHPEKEMFDRLPAWLGLSNKLFVRLMAQALREEKDWPSHVEAINEEVLRRIREDRQALEADGESHKEEGAKESRMVVGSEADELGLQEVSESKLKGKDKTRYILRDIRRFLLHGMLPGKERTEDLEGLSAWMMSLAEKGDVALRTFLLEIFEEEEARLRFVTQFPSQLRTTIGALLWAGETAFPPAWYSLLLDLFDRQGVGPYTRTDFLEALDLTWLEELPDKSSWERPGLIHTLARLLGARPGQLKAHLLFSLQQIPELQTRVREVWEIWEASTSQAKEISLQEEDSPKRQEEDIMKSMWYFLEFGTFPEGKISLKEGGEFFFQKMESTPLEVLGKLETLARKVNLPERLVTHFEIDDVDKILTLGLSIEAASGEHLWQEWTSWFGAGLSLEVTAIEMREEALRILFSRDANTHRLTPFFRNLLERLAGKEGQTYREYLHEIWESATTSKVPLPLTRILEQLKTTLSATQVETLKESLIQLRDQDEESDRTAMKKVTIRDSLDHLAFHEEEAWWMSSQDALDQQLQIQMKEAPAELLDLLAIYWLDPTSQRTLQEQIQTKTYELLEAESSGDYLSLVQVYRESLEELLDEGLLGEGTSGQSKQFREELLGQLIQKRMLSSTRLLQELNLSMAKLLELEEKELVVFLRERAQEGIRRGDIRYYRLERLLDEEFSRQTGIEASPSREKEEAKWEQQFASAADSELEREVVEKLQSDPSQLLYFLEGAGHLPDLREKLARSLSADNLQALLSFKHRALGPLWALLEKSAEEMASTGKGKSTQHWRVEGRAAILNRVFVQKEVVSETLVKTYLDVLSSVWNQPVSDLAKSLLKVIKREKQPVSLLLIKSLTVIIPTPDPEREEPPSLLEEMKGDMQNVRHFLLYGSLPFGVQLSLSAMGNLQGAWIEDYPSLATEFYRSLLHRAQAVKRLVERFDERLWMGVLRLLLPRESVPLRELWIELSALLPGLLTRYREKDQRQLFFQMVLISLGEQRSRRFERGRFLIAWLSTLAAPERLSPQQVLKQIKARLHEGEGDPFIHLRSWLPALETALRQKRLEKESQDMTDSLDKSLFIQNAGLVILAPYLPRYFNMLNMLEGSDFNTQEARIRAIHLLQFLISGEADTPEHLLTFNKILCGLPLDVPVPLGITPTEAEKDVSEQLLNAVLTNWEKLKNSTLDTLRDSFLMREGKLLEEEEFWSLVVEEKAFDIVLEFLPWTISVVKLPWMSKRIEVKWKTRT